MIPIQSRFICLGLGLALLSLPPCRAQSFDVIAASSTQEAVDQINTRFAAQESLENIGARYESSSRAARAIEAGNEFHVFISANRLWIDHLQERSLLQGEPRHFASNRLVLVQPKGRPTPTDLQAFLKNSLIAIGDPTHVPVGIYAKQALSARGWWDDAVAQRMIACRNVREALRLVTLNEADAAVIYMTDAMAERDKVNVLLTFGENEHDPIQYLAATTTTSHPSSSKYIDFLFSQEAALILQSYGFQPVTRPAQTDHKMELRPIDHKDVVGKAVLVSLRVACLCLLVSFIPGIFLAWLLARKDFPGKTLVEAMVYAPLVLPPVITGYALLLFFGRNGLFGAYFEKYMGITLAFNSAGAVIAAAVMGFPLLVRAARLGFEMVDPGLETAAATLGAPRRTVWFRITLPLALPGILTGLVLAFARGLGEFGATIVFAGNVAGETQTIPLAVFSLMQQPGAERTVFQLSLIAIALSLIALALSDFGAKKLRQRLRGTE